ncbi:MAG: adenylate/guanylate cyclase domain-containing protein [Acidimicrobiia bacterium]
MADLPTGTVTFLFTDIEGSTRLLQELGESYHDLQETHAAILRAAISSGGGTEISTEGDSFFAVFRTAAGAARAVAEAQKALDAGDWPAGAEVRVRMGLHTGEAILGGDNYLGLDVNRAARISAAAHGGQVLLSEATAALAKGALETGVDLRDLGPHRLKDIEGSAHLYQLVVEGLDQDFPPPRTLDARPNNLPAQLSSFVGRTDDIARISEVVAQQRLVTLTGPGGTGKTRLALEVAGSVLVDFRDGAFFVDLSAVSDPELVAQVTADTLGVKQQPDRELLSLMAEHLAQLELLLVLDNFEQVVEAAPVVGQLLRETQNVKALVTSRIPLHVSGEQEFAVAPLELPDEDRLDLEELSTYEAIALFIERARSTKEDFELSDENAGAVANICVRLDGLPLAIELAASRVKLLSPQAIQERLEQALPLLVSPLQDLPERQRTLRGAIAWSYELLNRDEQALFSRIGALPGGGDFEAIDVLAQDAALDDSLGVLTSLVDKSLVRQTESDRTEPRYGMLETIREFALERLDEADDGHPRRRVTEHWLDLLASFDWEPQPDRATIVRLDEESPNFRASFDWTLEIGEATLGLRLATELRGYWLVKNHFREGIGWLERLLALPGAEEPSAVRARALTCLADLNTFAWDERIDSLTLIREAAEIFREIDDRPGLADSLSELGIQFLVIDDLASARQVLIEGRALSLEVGNKTKTAQITLRLGLIEMTEGDLAAARRMAEEARGGFEESDQIWLLFVSRVLGHVDRLEGNLEAAEARYRRGLESSQEVGNLHGVSIALWGYAGVAVERGDYERAVKLYEGAKTAREMVGKMAEIEGKVFGDIEDARRHMNEKTFDKAREEGRSMSVEEAIAYALGEPNGATGA